MKLQSLPETFTPFSRWAPRSPLYWTLRPQKAWSRWMDDHVPLEVCVRPSTGKAYAGHVSLVWWSYDQERHGRKLHLRFESSKRVVSSDSRWRAVAAALWRMIQKDPSITFQDVAVDLEDGCVSETPDFAFCFARRIGGSVPLLPNPYLTRKRHRVSRPLPWDSKTDMMYFRGADSGSADLEQNTRVVLCRTAAKLPGTDCRLSRLAQGGPEFHEQIRREGLVSKRVSLGEMNRHKYLVDTDGNTTSWDRYLWTGTFGGVPIRFEPTWEECWHGSLREGENCVMAHRVTLGEVLKELRADPARAKRIAAGASALVATQLSPAGVQEMFETAWKQRLSRAG